MNVVLLSDLTNRIKNQRNMKKARCQFHSFCNTEVESSPDLNNFLKGDKYDLFYCGCMDKYMSKENNILKTQNHDTIKQI